MTRTDSLVTRDGYLTNDVQGPLILALLADSEEKGTRPYEPVLYEWLCETVRPPFGEGSALTLGVAEWQVDFTGDGGPLIIGTGNQLSEMGVGFVGSIRAYAKVPGFRSVLTDIAARATECGCTVWPWSPEHLERLAVTFQQARLTASYGPVVGHETNHPDMAGIRAVLREMADMHGWHPETERDETMRLLRAAP